MCVNVCPLTSYETPSPEEDGEGGSVAVPGVGGVHIWDVELTHDHTAFHHASNFFHSLER